MLILCQAESFLPPGVVISFKFWKAICNQPTCLYLCTSFLLLMKWYTALPSWKLFAWLHVPDIAFNMLRNPCFFSGLQTHKAIRTFKIMRSCSLPSNVAIYNVMIECCKLLPCLKSSYTLLSLMLRDGFCPTVVTFTSLLKVCLDKM
jgi:hypothetical protein